MTMLMDGCEARKAILEGTAPDDLSVGGSLDLSGCTGLTSLPDGLSVGRSLWLYGCNESLLLDARARGFRVRA